MIILSTLQFAYQNEPRNSWLWGALVGVAAVIALVTLVIHLRTRKHTLLKSKLRKTSIERPNYTNSDSSDSRDPLDQLFHSKSPRSNLGRVPTKAPVTSAMTRYDTFLSYDREDELDVRTIYEYLTEIGLKVWFDLENINPGDDWIEAMQDGLKNSQTCLVFFRNEPGIWQKEETKAAIRKKAQNLSFKIIPVLLPGGMDAPPSMPSLLEGTQWVDLRDGLFKMPALKKLREAIRAGEIVSIHQIPEGSETDDELPSGYRADVKKIISLLIGEALYSRRDVSIREIIQNSVDACERKGNSRSGAGTRADVVFEINTNHGFFEVRDNGDGMNPQVLSEYFSVIGKSIKDEENILDRVQENEKTRVYLISKFGIGFISAYILAQKILISTTSEGFDQINLEISGISEPFVYSKSSRVGRPPEEIGTTVRVRLKQAFLNQGSAPIDLLASVEAFCRHVEFVRVLQDGSPVILKDTWNTESAMVTQVSVIPFKFELHLGLSSTNLDFFASNAGFLISRTSDAISPVFMPTNIGGEINLYPGVVDLNMARDTIIENEKSLEIMGAVSKAIRSLLIKASSNVNKEGRKKLLLILLFYLEQALEHEKAESADNFQPVPLSSIEAAELLMDVWFVTLNGKELSLREALGVVKHEGRYRAYAAGYYHDKPLLKIMQESLTNRGFLVIEPQGGTIEFKSGHSEFVIGHRALEYLSKRYFFDLYEVESPFDADLNITITAAELSSTLQEVLSDIELTTGKNVPLARLPGAPIVFELAGKNFLNVGSELFTKVETILERYDKSRLKSYVLGLLQYEIS